MFISILPGGCGVSTYPNDWDADAQEEFHAAETLRIGSVDDLDAGFSRISGLAVDRNGRMYVLDSQERQVRVYDEAGARVGTFGRRGAGPGEFLEPVALGLLNDTLWVRDVGTNRITFFSPAGQPLRSVQTAFVPVSSGIPGIQVMMAMAEPMQGGRFLGKPQTAIMRQPEAHDGDSIAIPVFVFDSMGSVVDTVGTVFHRLPRFVRVAGLSLIPPVVSDEPLVATLGADSIIVSRSAAAAGEPAAFTVTRLGAGSDTVMHARYRYRPVRLTDQFIDDLVEQRTRPFARNANAAAIRSALRRAVDMPDYHPPVSALHVGADGSLWLRREDSHEAEWRWLVLHPDGTPRGVVRLPRSVSPSWIRGDQLWAVTSDELDVPWVVQYTITPPSE